MKTQAALPMTMLAALVLAGCASTPGGSEAEGQAPAVQPAEAPAQPPAAPVVLAHDLAGIIELFENGRGEDALVALRAYLEREPRSAAARNLLRQMEGDPVALLGAAHRLYVVQPGDTLGGLAARFLGDPVRFVVLARYNGITRPKALRAGQTIRIPTEFHAAGVTAEAGEAAEKAAPGPQALPAGEEGGSQTAAPVPVPDPGQLHQQRALALMQEGRLEAAHEAFGQALAHTPDLEPARRQRAELGRRLVTGYHEAAVVHFRNQRLDEAIALWDKALALDPGFEPARGYRTRALELKRRLNELAS